MPMPTQTQIPTAAESHGKFSTKDLRLATFLHATGKLPFLGCKLGGNAREVYFEFSDSDGIADDLELAFERGEPVSATALFSSQRYLHKKIAATLEGGRDDGNGKGNSNSNHGVFYERTTTSR